MINKIKKERLISIDIILKNFDKLPPTLKTDKYKRYLISTRQLLLPVIKEIDIPNNKLGRVIGLKGSYLKQMENDFQCSIKITGNICVIEGDKAELVVQHIREILTPHRKIFKIDEMTDWEKFYVWWAYHNKKM